MVVLTRNFYIYLILSSMTNKLMGKLNNKTTKLDKQSAGQDAGEMEACREDSNLNASCVTSTSDQGPASTTDQGPIDYYVETSMCVDPKQAFGIVGISHVLLVTIGIPSNIIGIWIIKRKQLLRMCSIHWYLVSGLVMDVLYLILLIPESIMVFFLKNNARFGLVWSYYRPLQYATEAVLATTSRWVILCLSVDRLILMFAPNKGATLLSYTRSKYAVILVLIVTVGLRASLAFEFEQVKVYDPDGQVDTKLLVWGGVWMYTTYRRISTMLGVVLDLMGPVLIMVCAVVMVIKSARCKQTKPLQEQNQEPSFLLQPDGARIVVLISAVLFFTIIPLVLSYMFQLYKTTISEYVVDTCSCVFYLLGTITAAAKFLLYACASKNIRQGALSLFKNKDQGQNNHSDSENDGKDTCLLEPHVEITI